MSSTTAGVTAVAVKGSEDGAAHGAAHRLVFIKLGGSLVSDKTKPETLRADVLSRIARYPPRVYNNQQRGAEVILGT